jgi:hypothetical protein
MKTQGELMADEEEKKPSAKDKARAVKNAQKPRQPVTNDDDSDAGGDPKNSKDGAQVQTVDPRKFVVINPPLKGDPNRVNEGRSQSQIDYLIRLGLGDNDRLNFYRQVMTDPKKANDVPYLRKYVAEVLDLTLDIIFKDPQMYNRVRTKLQDNLPQGGVRSGMKKIEDALEIKAKRSGISADVLFEVYNREIEAGGDQEKAFNRVNSFIAGGRARQLDVDLIKKALRGNND